MASWAAVKWVVIALAVPGGLYGLHRLGLWLEARGYIYYKKRGGRAGGGFIALQEIIDPRVQHVLRTQDGEEQVREDGAPPLFKPGGPDGSHA